MNLLVRYITDNEEETIHEPSPVAYLILLVNKRGSQTFPMRGEVQLGRDKSNSVVVSDQKVSRFHAILTPIDDTFILSDRGSANGTYLNGVLISQPTRLKSEDRIAIGDTSFLFTSTLPGNLDAIDPPVSGSELNQPAQAVLQNQALTKLGVNNQPVWVIIGCLGLVIVALLLTLAILLGLMIGRGQVDAGAALLMIAQLA